MRSTRHLSSLNTILKHQVAKAASPGERVIASVFPSRGSGYPGFWFSDRIQQVYHLRNWQYICIDLIARKKASVVANVCYKTDRPIRGSTVKCCQRSLAGLFGSEFALGADPFVGASVQTSSTWRDPKTTSSYGNYVGIDGYDPRAKAAGSAIHFGSAIGFSGGGHSFLTMGEWRSKALSVVKPQDNLMPLEADHPYRRLQENPNPVDTPFDIIYERDMFRKLCGIAYIWTPKNRWGQPCEKWVIPSHWVYPRTGAGQYVPFNHEHADELVWDYEIRPWGYPGYAGVLHFPPDEVIVYRNKHPLSKIDGWSQLAAGAQIIDLEEATTQTQWSQMINQAVPGLVVKMGPGYEDIDDNEISRIEAKFFQRVQGAFNYGKPLFLPSGAEATPFGFNPTEMAYQTAQDQARDRVLSLFGVTKAAIGLVDNMTYGSVMATLGTLHSLVINPELISDGQTETKHLASQFDEKAPAFSTMTGGGHGASVSERKVVCFFDDTVPADPQQVNSDIQLDITAYAITPNEVRALRGRQPFRRGGDNPIVNGPGGPMPMVINADEDVSDMAAIMEQLANAQKPVTRTEDVGEDGQPLPEGEQQPTADDHGGSGLEPPEETNTEPKTVNKRLDRLGGEAPTVDPQQLADADFITMPTSLPGTRCKECTFNKGGVCQFVGKINGRHVDIRGQKVNERNCCAAYDNPELLRAWRKTLKGWLHPAIRQRLKSAASAANVRAFPPTRQGDGTQCGAAEFAANAALRGHELSVDQAAELLGTDSQGTDWRAIQRQARRLGIGGEAGVNMSLSKLKELTDAGCTVMCPIQDYGNANGDQAGHWVTALEVSDSSVLVHDPSLENVKGEPGGSVPDGEADASGDQAKRGVKAFTHDKWLEVWHDVGRDGTELRRMGVVFDPPGKVAKGNINPAGVGEIADPAGHGRPSMQVKGEGSCEVGQTAAQTGCVPQSGVSAERISTQKPAEDIKNEAIAIRNSLIRELKKIGMGDKSGTAGGCRLATIALVLRNPEAEVWSGNHGPEDHFFAKIGDLFYDVTGDQYGFPEIHISKKPPKVNKPHKVDDFFDDVSKQEEEFAREILNGAMSGNKKGVLAKSAEDDAAALSYLWSQVTNPGVTYAHIERAINDVAARNPLPALKDICRRLGIASAPSSKADFARRLIQRFSERKGRQERGDVIGDIATGRGIKDCLTWVAKHLTNVAAAPTIAVDFDGTISDCKDGDCDDFDAMQPRDGAVEGMRALRDAGVRVVVWTANDHPEGVRAWLDRHGVPYDDVNAKLEAAAYVDDKAVSARQDWPDIVRDAMARAVGNPRQPADNWDGIMELEAMATPELEAALDTLGLRKVRIADLGLGQLEAEVLKPGGVVLVAPTKKRDRAEEKVEADYGGDWSKLLDVYRAAVAVDTEAELRGLVQRLRQVVPLARLPKDRIREPLANGYRDVLCNVKLPCGAIAEVQFHLKPVLIARERERVAYDVARAIKAAMEEEGREEMTPAEAEATRRARQASRGIFARAWEEATAVKEPQAKQPRSLGNPNLATPARGKRTAPRDYTRAGGGPSAAGTLPPARRKPADGYHDANTPSGA